MKFIYFLLLSAVLTTSPWVGAQTPKKELVNKLLQLQQPGIETIARQLAEQPAAQMMQQAGQALQGIPESKRETTGKAIESEVRKYVNEAVPLVQQRAVKLAPTVTGPMLEEQFSEDELKQLVAWFESPVNKKYSQAVPGLNEALVRKLIDEAKPAVDPKLETLETSVRKLLEDATPKAAARSASSPSKAKPTAK